MNEVNAVTDDRGNAAFQAETSDMDLMAWLTYLGWSMTAARHSEPGSRWIEATLRAPRDHDRTGKIVDYSLADARDDVAAFDRVDVEVCPSDLMEKRGQAVKKMHRLAGG